MLDTLLRYPYPRIANMSDRDVERDCSVESFVDTLRRLADSLENKEPFRIQVVSKRFTVPAGASLSIEHEAAKGEEELELQLRWKS
jgi:amphi-Trp domain-containing protein